MMASYLSLASLASLFPLAFVGRALMLEAARMRSRQMRLQRVQVRAQGRRHESAWRL